jgi:hypothetical protein
MKLGALMKNHHSRGGNPAVYVFYHANCLDGLGAAWAAWTKFGNTAVYLPVHHHQPMPPFPKSATLYILDFCYSPEQLVLAAASAKEIVVLDHHVSAREQFSAYRSAQSIPDNLTVHFNLEHSGCTMAWAYFQPHRALPQLLLHIEDRDLWRHRWKETASITHALYQRMPLPVDRLADISLPTLRREGEILVKERLRQVELLLRSRHTVTINGITGLAVNAPPSLSSDLGQALSELSGTFGLTYRFHGKRKLWECSLRSNGACDVAEMASAYGGGGHRQAAGFVLPSLDILGVITRRPAGCPD